MSVENKYRQYQYFITYKWGERDGNRVGTRTTPLTVDDLKGDMIAAEIMDEIQKRIEEIERAEEYNLYVEIIAVNLLTIINV